MDRAKNKLVRAIHESPLPLLIVLLLLATPVLAKSKSYAEMLDKWTRHGSDYTVDNFEARLIWHATYQSREFRTARAEEKARIYQSSDAEKEGYLKTEKEEGDLYDDFFISLYVGSGAWLDVGKNPQIWKLVLILPGGGEVKPISINKVKTNSLQRLFYPYIDKWSPPYEVRFNKVLADDPKEFTLAFIGVPATSRLVWKFKEGDSPKGSQIVRKTKTEK